MNIAYGKKILRQGLMPGDMSVVGNFPLAKGLCACALSFSDCAEFPRPCPPSIQ